MTARPKRLLPAALLILAGCTVGPDYEGPPQMVAADRPFARAATVPQSPGPLSTDGGPGWTMPS